MVSSYVKKKARRLIKDGMVEMLGDFEDKAIFRVKRYEVHYNKYFEMADSCTCFFFEKSHGQCSHMTAANFFMGEEGKNE